MTRSCGGATEDAANVFTANSITPLSGVACAYCARMPSAEMEWKAKLPTRRITEKLRPLVKGAVVYRLGRVKRVEAASTGRSGRATVLRIETAFGPFEMPVEGFRSALGEGVLPAAPSHIRDAGPETIEFAGRGEGPGVGLCRLGAEQMSREGKPFEDILRRYFPGARLARLPYGAQERGQPAPRR